MVLISTVLRRSQIEILVEPLLRVASQVPFSEKDSACIGAEAEEVRSTTFSKDFVSKSLSFADAVPIARRCPSGWKAVQVRSVEY